MDKSKELIKAINDLKRQIASFGGIDISKEDLRAAGFNIKAYSNDIYIYRSQTDKFVYLADRNDGIEGRISVTDLEIILESIAQREIKEANDLSELERFLIVEEVE